MDEVLLRRLVGVLTLALAAFLLSWLLPRPGLRSLQGETPRVVTMDLRQPDSVPVEGAAATAAEPEITAPLTAAGPVSEASELEVDPLSPAPTAAPAPAAPGVAASAPKAVVTAPKQAEPPAATPPAPNPAPPPAAVPKPGKPKPAPSEAVAREAADEAARASALLQGGPEAGAAPAVKPIKPAARPVGAWQVQAGAYAQLDRAQDVIAKARSRGVSCLVSPADTAQGTLYRVRCGPYAARELAQIAVAKLGQDQIKAQVVAAGG